MTRQNHSRILAIIVLLSTLFSFEKMGAWYCDGRVCSTSSVCCCQFPGRAQDALCRDRDFDIRNVGVRKEDGCGAGCKCKLVVKAATVRDASISSHVLFVAPALAVLPALPTITYAAPPVSETILLHIETRGPPRAPLNFRNLSLRAPPAA